MNDDKWGLFVLRYTGPEPKIAASRRRQQKSICGGRHGRQSHRSNLLTHGAGDSAGRRAGALPDRPIHIVVPFPAGGPSDVLTRIIAERMSADFGQGVVVDNRPGANTLIGAQFVAKAEPDGYTLLMAIDSTLVMNQYLYSNLPYDPIKDFAPITLTAKTTDLLVVNAQSDIETAKDLIAKAKAQPGKLNCGAGTITTKLTCVFFAEKAGIDTVLIPYNGSAEVAHGVLTGSVDYVFDGTAAELPLVQAGNLRALAKLDSRPFAAATRAAVVVAGNRRRPRRSHGLDRSGRAARYPAGR